MIPLFSIAKNETFSVSFLIVVKVGFVDSVESLD